jgi:hypothetical protein
MSEPDVYDELGAMLENDLHTTGFSMKNSPPCEAPNVYGGLSKLDLSEIRDLYDRYLAYYDYITDQIAGLEIYRKTTEKRLERVHATLTLQASENRKLSNADLRKAWVVVHDTYQAAQQDHLYFKQMLSAQERRYRKLSKVKEDVSRELWSRTQGTTTGGRPDNTEEIKRYTNRNMFRKVGND